MESKQVWTIERLQKMKELFASDLEQLPACLQELPTKDWFRLSAKVYAICSP